VTKSIGRRNFWRTIFHAPVLITAHKKEVYVQLLDISLKGALIETNDGWHANLGEECLLCLNLAPETTINMQAIVMHVEEPHIGLQCKSIDIDSITHLRRLVELNSGAPEILDRELRRLIHKD
jgi:hypothetical protein